MASVSAAGALDSQYITASVASTGKKDSKSYMDFGKVVEQVRSKTYKSQTTNQKVSSKTENSLNQNVKKNAAVKDRNKNADDTSKTDVNDAAAQTVSDSHVNADNTDSPCHLSDGKQGTPLNHKNTPTVRLQQLQIYHSPCTA